jgi:hypothetical protein
MQGATLEPAPAPSSGPPQRDNFPGCNSAKNLLPRGANGGVSFGFRCAQFPDFGLQQKKNVLRVVATLPIDPADVPPLHPVQGAKLAAHWGTIPALAPLPPAHARDGHTQVIEKRVAPFDIYRTRQSLHLPSPEEFCRARRVFFKSGKSFQRYPTHHFFKR